MEVSKGLTASQFYLDALPEVIAQIANGCGPAGWKIDIVPDTIYGLSIKEVCGIHDVDYLLGASEEDKDVADNRFLANCYTAISNDKSFLGYVLHYPRRIRAKEYYAAVHLLGHDAFWAGKEQLRAMSPTPMSETPQGAMA